MLGSSATKRDARAYLSRFGSLKPLSQALKTPLLKCEKENVNLGTLSPFPRAVDESPLFSQTPEHDHQPEQAFESIHVALVKIKDPQSLNNKTLQAVGHTLSQLTRLGLICVVVVDCQGLWKETGLNRFNFIYEQVNRVVSAIDHSGGQRARRLDGVIEVSSVDERYHPLIKLHGEVRITHRNLLLAPLRREAISVVVPVGFDSTTQMLVSVDADEVILALTKEFAGISDPELTKEDPFVASINTETKQKQISLDRIILLDPQGGIPSQIRYQETHRFINLEQEYEAIKTELFKPNDFSQKQGSTNSTFQATATPKSPEFIDRISDDYKNKPSFPPNNQQGANQQQAEGGNCFDAKAHLKNLELLNNTLSMLPSSSSALLTTPQEAAYSWTNPQGPSRILGVGTRRTQNPLIHSLLTDKPVLSSSLPSKHRSRSAFPAHSSTPLSSPTTFVKRGMPVTIIPDPKNNFWENRLSPPSVQLSDLRIDPARLVYLIEDSFGRKLDVQNYLSRIENRIAGIIIAGDYEGMALFTWEDPAAFEHHSRSSSASSHVMVPYLDKFAVLKRSQGAGGVADIVFNAMVRDCFPNGVCWRSRQENPVNKWYFERAKGTRKIPGTQWTMFWTTEGIDAQSKVFEGYEKVCRGVEPCWKDKRRPAD